jgi:oligoribonuclease
MGNLFAAVVDLETTGTAANLDVPLEVGIQLINREGEVQDAESWLVYENSDDYGRGMARGMSNPLVNEMHTKSGLWEDLRGNARVINPRSFVDEKLCDFLEQNNVEPRTLPMMGNSIGSLDRPFCIVHFPKFNAHLSHRNIDVSTIKELMKAYNPALFEALKPVVGTKEDSKHRVMDDIEACIREHLTYVTEFFITEDF